MHAFRFWALLMLITFGCRTASDLNQTYHIPTATPESVGISTTGLSQVDSVLQAYIRELQVPAVEAIIIREGKMVYHHAYGLRNIASQDVLEENDIFRIASMTKPVTTVAALMLYEEGKFDLDDPISDYLPTFANAKVLQNLNMEDSTYNLVAAERPVTIRDLMSHQSGIGYIFIQPEANMLYSPKGIIDAWTLDSLYLKDVIDSLGTAPLLHQPGKNWTYGLGLDVIGRLIEVISGQSLAEFMQSRIFDPLEMDDTGFYQAPEKADRLVSIYVPDEEGKMISLADIPEVGSQVDYPIKGAQTYYSGGGGLTYTAEDYARFALMLENGGSFNGTRILQEKTVLEMASNQLDPAVFGQYQYGLGVAINPARENALYPEKKGRFGWSGYFKTRYWADPSEDLVIVMMCQMGPGGKAADEMMGKAIKMTYQSLIREETP